MSDDLVAFLRARLDEHARLQRGLDCDCDWPGAQHPEPGCPVFLLADIDAKRQIIDEYERACRATYTGSETADRYVIEPIVCLLALPYADHSNYRQEWRP